jgi:hypothetical protein
MKNLIVVLLCLVLAGCVAPATHRGIIDNQIFYSTGIPKIKVALTDKPDRVFSHKDRVFKKFENRNETFIEDRETFVFLYLDEDLIKNAVVIKYLKMNKGYYFPEIFSFYKTPFDSGKKLVDGRMFMSVSGLLTSNAMINDSVEDQIEQAGIGLPNYFLVRTLGRRIGVGKNSIIYISYLENLNLTGDAEFFDSDWADITLFNDKQKRILKDVKKRAENAFIISHELDSFEPETIEQSNSVTTNLNHFKETLKNAKDLFFASKSESHVTTQDEPFTAKLKLLKQSYEASLITKEEYETKKSALLDEL